MAAIKRRNQEFDVISDNTDESGRKESSNLSVRPNVAIDFYGTDDSIKKVKGDPNNNKRHRKKSNKYDY